jgi:hypothetical protein
MRFTYWMLLILLMPCVAILAIIALLLIASATFAGFIFYLFVMLAVAGYEATRSPLRQPEPRVESRVERARRLDLIEGGKA